MKYSHLILALALAVSFCACKKKSESDPKNDITYPEQSWPGPLNILAMADNSDLAAWDSVNTNSYCLSAGLESNASLKIVMTNLSVPDSFGIIAQWLYEYQPRWSISGSPTTAQSFSSTSDRNPFCYLKFLRYVHNGSMRVDFYENSSTITRSKYFTWH